MFHFSSTSANNSSSLVVCCHDSQLIFMAPTNQVLVKESSNVRTIVLNRPKQLNALSGEMVSRLLELFLAYEEDPNVKLIIMKGEGRAFCAGGDVAAVVNDIKNGNWKLGADFFSKEFRLNYLMATYTKPQLSLLRGIVMGGGAGASIHGRFRVATDNSVFAMPETALGLFPDVGASYYLSRTPGFFGEYVGLTGARLDGAEMLACGLATHFVPLEKLSLLEDALCKANTGDPIIINNIINEFSSTPKLKEKSQYFRLKTIERCFSRRTVEEIISALEKEADKNMDDWIAWTIESLKKASPTSLKISLRSIREGRLQGVIAPPVTAILNKCHKTQTYIVKCHLPASIMQQSGSGSETEVTWEDQQNINKFGRLNNRYHELEDEIKIAKEANENFEDASNELILTDEEVVRFQIGEVFAHVPKDEVETRIEQMQETTAKHLEKLNDEKESILAQMAELKKLLYAKFKESINLEED